MQDLGEEDRWPEMAGVRAHPQPPCALAVILDTMARPTQLKVLTNLSILKLCRRVLPSR